MEEIKSILKENAMHIVDIEVATQDEDYKQCTDLKINITVGNVAVRIRRFTTFRDLTIRAYQHGYKTEIHKLREGYAKYYLYLWTNNVDDICDWILVDIDKMRNEGLLSENRKVTMNKDGRTGFINYSIPELITSGALLSRKN